MDKSIRNFKELVEFLNVPLDEKVRIGTHVPHKYQMEFREKQEREAGAQKG